MTTVAVYGGDFIKEVSTTTATGNIQLPNVAATGFATFDSWWSNGQRLPYSMTNGTGKWEVGVGTYISASHEISRDYVWWSSNSGAVIDFTGETVNVISAPNSGGADLSTQNHWQQGNVAPSTSNDITMMFDASSFWHNVPGVASATVGSLYTCLDATTGAAFWVQIFTSDSKMHMDGTYTAGGTTGAQTINKPTGSVNFAASATSLVVTNSLVTTASVIMAVLQTNDATAALKNVVPGSGSFTINLTAAATAETKAAFWVFN
jgi:hypothetical protein